MLTETTKEIKDILGYRELLRNLVVRDIKVRYKRSILGFLWVMLNPLLMMVVFYLVFSSLFQRTVHNYIAYVITGITVWHLYAQSTSRATRAFFESANILKKKALPRSIFPLSMVVSAVVNFLFSLVPMYIILIVSGASPLKGALQYLPICILLILTFTYGVSLLLSTVTVFFHDTIYIYEVLLLALMYLSAIFYPVQILPEGSMVVVNLNPLYHYINLFRACVYDSTLNPEVHLFYSSVYAFASILVGWTVYFTNRQRIVFYL